MSKDPIMDMDAWKEEYPDDAAKKETRKHEKTKGLVSETLKTPNELHEGVTNALAEDDMDIESSIFPSESERPQYVVLDEWVEESRIKYKPGVWYCGIAKGKANNFEVFNTWICGSLHIDAMTRDIQDNNFGRLLRFKNGLGRWRTWAMPMELLKGSGEELRGELLSMGLALDSQAAKIHLPKYLQWRTPKRKMLCAMQIGWADNSFVLPDIVIGNKSAEVVFQTGERCHDEHNTGGSLQGWQDGIASKAPGNPLLILALSASFSGPLLAKCNMEGGGIHFVGDSSTGKTTAIEAACATWGGSNFKRSWRATANGMEGAALLFNDCLLALDEISECDPREVGTIIYSLGNGTGKQRANRSGSAKGITRWRCFVLSSGERTISTTIAESGQKAKAGQTMRLLDIPVARTHGAWDNLHGMPNGTSFSDSIKRVAANHYGYAGRAFLEKLTREQRNISDLLDQKKNLEDFQIGGVEGQDKRAIGRFAIMALAGELATEYGITGWSLGEATRAAVDGFRIWQSMRGKGNDERRRILECISDFIDQYSDGKFSDIQTSDVTTRVLDRAGYWRDTPDGREYLFSSNGIKSALKGFDNKRAMLVLEDEGVLKSEDGKAIRVRAGKKQIRVYPILYDRLEASI